MAVPHPVETSMLTVEEFLTLDLPEGKAELVRGEVRVTPPAGGPHAKTVANLVVALAIHVRAHTLGTVFTDGTGYELIAIPRTVRVPDASFVRAERLPGHGIGPGLLKLAPDLAVEVLSPSETATELQEKLDDYRVAGVAEVWVVDPMRRTVMIVAADAPLRWLRENDVLTGGEVIPGFRCRVDEIFEGIARQ